MAKDFSEKEQKILLKNPYTLSVSNRSLRFTKDFKEEFWHRYTNGQYPKRILSEMGYDLDILGEARIISIYQAIKRQAHSDIGFHEHNVKPCPKDPVKDLKDLTQDQAFIRMQHELLYMRQEMEFIKKIIKLDNSGKPKP